MQRPIFYWIYFALPDFSMKSTEKANYILLSDSSSESTKSDGSAKIVYRDIYGKIINFLQNHMIILCNKITSFNEVLGWKE